jgi:folate-dependent phosphoribosylglycinamide formyltransferase PurN
MINENLFKIENLKNVVLLGGAKFFDKIIKINENFKLKTEIISCSHQIKELDLSNKIKKFDKLDDKFKKYLINKYNFDHTIFISLGARYIFQKETINNFFKNRLINFHGTRLPYDSGGAGHSWKIMRHDRIDNQLVHIVDEGVDSGPV